MDVSLTIKHAFGSTALPSDGLQSFASAVGDRDINDRLLFRVGRKISVLDPDSGFQVRICLFCIIYDQT